jgi:hypothetical protein
MKTELLGLVAACALVGSTVAANASPYVVTMEEVGSNVVATGSGSIDVTNLAGTTAVGGCCEIGPTIPFIFLSTGSSEVDYEPATPATPFAGPTSFGTGPLAVFNNSSGPVVGFFGTNPLVDPTGDLILPSGYSNDTPLGASVGTFDNATFASLGLTPGTYVWTWGTGADQSFTLEIGTTPLPAALPLFATGLGALGLLGWRRKRKAAAAAA